MSSPLPTAEFHRWAYRQTTFSGRSETGATKHMALMAADGWELVSANAVFVMNNRIYGYQGPVEILPSGSVDHCFYWRQPWSESLAASMTAASATPVPPSAPQRAESNTRTPTPERVKWLNALVERGELTREEADTLVLHGRVSDANWERVRRPG